VTGRIRILYLGDAWGERPFTNLETEPTFALAGVPASRAHMGGTYDELQLRQFVRIYLPRTYEDLISKSDLLVLSDTNHNLYTPNQLVWLGRAVTDSGMGLMMVGGAESFGGNGHPTWTGSTVEGVLPVECRDQKVHQRTGFGVQPLHPEEPFTTSLPWESMPFFQGMNLVGAKEGALVLLRAMLDSPYPVVVHWEIGEGSALAHTPDWNGYWVGGVTQWEYYIDYVANLNLLNAGAAVPQDLALVHSLRRRFFNYHSSRSVVTRGLEFASKFGARTLRAEKSLSEIAEMEKDAERLYLLQEYDDAFSRLDEVEVELIRLSDRALRLKDSALTWIYVIEWFAVTGTGMACGTVLWTVMVRRRFYREVAVTRMIQGPD
jgi:uncharacterized membrane protein